MERYVCLQYQGEYKNGQFRNKDSAGLWKNDSCLTHIDYNEERILCQCNKFGPVTVVEDTENMYLHKIKEEETE